MKKIFMLSVLSICLIRGYSQTAYYPTTTTGTGGTNNSNFGYYAGNACTGNSNVNVGYYSGRLCTGASNTLVGFNAGYSITSGSFNLSLGHQAGYQITTGSRNTFVGTNSGHYLTTGSNNTFVGLQAGFNNVTGIGNVFLGFNAGQNELGSNKLYIANSSTTTPLIYGDFAGNLLTVNGSLGIGTNSTSALFTINGSSGNPSMYVIGDTKIESGSIKMSRPSNTTAQASINISSISGPLGLRFAMSDDGSFSATHTFDALFLGSTGNVGIGNTNPTAKLTVNGDILCEKVKVISSVPASDFVFDKDYKLKNLAEIEAYVKANKHLPEVPSAEEFKKDGYEVGEMDDLLLRKVEELTLYVIELNKKIAELEAKTKNPINNRAIMKMLIKNLITGLIIIFINPMIYSQSMNWIDVGRKVTDADGMNAEIGRIDYLAFDPNNPDVIFACSPWGGVFRTTDRGLNWHSVGLEFKVEQPASSCIYIDPLDDLSQTWYVASGNTDGPPYDIYQRESKGIYRTTNGGGSWQSIGPFLSYKPENNIVINGTTFYTGSYLINDIIQGPESRQHLIISTTSGIYETKDALSESPHWNCIPGLEGNFGSVVFQPGHRNIIFCAEQFVLNPRIIKYNLTTLQIEAIINYSSYINITTPQVRIALRFSKNINDADNLFIFFTKYLDNDNHGTFVIRYSILNNTCTPKGSINSGGWDRPDAYYISNESANNIYAQKENNEPQMFQNGLDSYTLHNPISITNNYIHVDQHFITQSPFDYSLWVANDGGVFELVGNHFEPRMTGLAVSTIRAFDVAQLENTTRYVAGYQDCDNHLTDYDLSIDIDDSHIYGGGDGFLNYFDPTDFKKFTGTHMNGETYQKLYKQDPVVKSISFINNVPLTKLYWDRQNSGVFYSIDNGVLQKSTNGGITAPEPWSPDFNVREFALSPTNPKVMYCFSNKNANGKSILYKSTTGGGTLASDWTTVEFGFADFGAMISLVDYENPDYLWVVGRVSQTDGRQDLYSINTLTGECMPFRTLKGGSTSPIPSGDWPQIISITQEYNSNQALYILANSWYDGDNISTDNIYYTDLTLNQWVLVKTGLPNILITDIKINNKGQEIYAATFGRGMWKSPLYCSAHSTNSTLPNPYVDKSMNTSGSITSSGVVGGLVTLRAGTEVDFNPGFETQSGTDLVAFVRPCGSDGGGLLKSADEDIIVPVEEIENDEKSESDDAISIFPNPSNGKVVVDLTSNYRSNSIIDVYDLQGRLIMQKSAGNGLNYLDFLDNKGLFIIKVTTHDKVTTSKVFVE